ncbi:MAG: hypothetical protein AB7H80_18440 [Candidatus Kapaibacterium sp.]
MQHHCKHIATVVDGDPFEIDGVNIWSHNWRSLGEEIRVREPLYGQELVATLQEITVDGKSIQFAPVEVSNCVWLIFVQV